MGETDSAKVRPDIPRILGFVSGISASDRPYTQPLIPSSLRLASLIVDTVTDGEHRFPICNLIIPRLTPRNLINSDVPNDGRLGGTAAWFRQPVRETVKHHLLLSSTAFTAMLGPGSIQHRHFRIDHRPTMTCFRSQPKWLSAPFRYPDDVPVSQHHPSAR
ncbi:hypothetical protein JAAARDRAFT_587510 [Jaapia argillacea MUCL 33604]|uniref:Uncharacterized protein n=1 Tax=Jaapia argillacea MUCL 33604 TaxID=933084 RepID=A0A067P8Y4_9AGAM|nr:hypothetical protein JAAARDRAFT_587510 [Jaapia argillacea MUCL 33604]